MTPTYALTSSVLPDTVAVAVSLQWRKVMNPLGRLFMRTLEPQQPTPEDILNEKLQARKVVRVAEQARAREAYWQKQRKLHAQDPILRSRRGLTDASADFRVSDAPNSPDTRLCDSGAGSSAAREKETGYAIPDMLDRMRGCSPSH